MAQYVDLKRLEFAVTYDCSSNCSHCFVDEEVQNKYPGVIDNDLAVRIVKDLGRQYELESIMTFGGEPLLYPEVTLAIHQEAKAIGIKKRQIITNGYWSKSHDKIKTIAEKTVATGVNEILISVDYFHQKYVPIEVVEKSAAALIKNGIELLKWNPCWVGNKSDDNKYNRRTKEILSKLEYLGVPAAEGNELSPAGLAIKNLKNYMPPKLKYPEGSCGDIPYISDLDKIDSICIEPDGDLSICKNLSLGNADSMNVIDILNSYNPFEVEELSCIIEKGMAGLLEYARENDIALDADGYYSICDMCSEILADFQYKV